MSKLSIRDLELSGKRVFIRVDFNVPLDGGRVSDDTRIRETLPTLKPRDRTRRAAGPGFASGPAKRESRSEIQPRAGGRKASELLGKPVAFASDCVGAEPKRRARRFANGEVLLLENVRYHAEEEKNDAEFSKQLAALCDQLFVCDAFGSAHRAHASVVGITKFVHQSAAGLLMEKELAYLGKAISNPERPFVAVLGGAKVSDKIEVVQNLMKLADAMLIGGAMAYTFLKSQGLPVGKSLVENDKLDLARGLLDEARSANSACSCRSITCSRNRPIPPQRKPADIADTPDDLDGPRHRPENDRAIRPGNFEGADDRLERPARHVREARIRAGHSRDGARRRGATAPAPLRSSAAAIPSPPSSSPASPIKFRTSPRAAALRSNSWRARNCRESKRSAKGERTLRRPVIAGNWKMYKTQAETRAFFDAFQPLVAESKHCDIIVAPPFTRLDRGR